MGPATMDCADEQEARLWVEAERRGDELRDEQAQRYFGLIEPEDPAQPEQKPTAG